jgi:hypothetical protein
LELGVFLCFEKYLLIKKLTKTPANKCEKNIEKSPKLFFVKENLKLEKILVFDTNSLSFKIMMEY